MSEKFRTATGGHVDRNRPLTFTFDGTSYLGLQGDTLASALLANGVHLVGRSFKYHRPRGIVSAGAEEPNALVTVRRSGGRVTPNLRATQVEVYDGLTAESQNRWPSLSFDAGAVSGLFSPFLGAGFYYKTFMGPRRFGAGTWTKVFEPLIRHAAGLGRAPEDADPDRYANRYAHCDVLVIGAGPAGLSAALAAADSGARVIVCDEQAELGGSLLSAGDVQIEGQPAAARLADTLTQLRANPRVRLLPRTQAFGYYAQNFVALVERLTDHRASLASDAPRERMWQVRAKEVVLATGAIERPLVFSGNDRPGVMLADAARTYLQRYGVRAGTRAVVFTACDTAYLAALDLHAAGVAIPMIADLRQNPHNELIAQARSAGIQIVTSATIIGTSGNLRISGAKIGRVRDGGAVDPAGNVACDLLLMSGGWTPSVHLFSQSRGKLAWSDGSNAFLPSVSAQHERSAGACRGTFVLGEVLTEGYAAGLEAGRTANESAGRVTARTFTTSEKPLDLAGITGVCPGTAPSGSRKAFVDFQNDVTAKDLASATAEGFRSIEHVKRYTTTGMATDQGKTSNINALGIVADAVGRPLPTVGLTTFRPPYTPVTFGTFAGYSRGDLFDPVRRTPIDGWAQQQGAAFEDVGTWKRAWYFARSGEDMHAAVARECRTVRETVGIFDASTLGKIEVVGPDAATFLDRMYVNAFSTLGVGKCRYGVLLNEAGFVMDDGVIGRLAPDRFHVTTTTGGAPRVLHMMEDYLQTEFPDLKAWLTSTTEQWGVIAVQGPKARAVLEPLIEGIDLARDQFAHMTVRDGKIAGAPCRLFRVSFTGELGFEVNVPASRARDVWEAIWAEVQRHGGCAYGTEAMHVMRAEKGFIIVGQETDGTVTPDDVGLTWAIGKSKPDFVGKRSLTRPDMVSSGRKQLVGLRTLEPTTVLEEGAQITQQANPALGTPALGHVTSSYWSATLGRPIAMALLADGRSRIGERLHVPMPNGSVAVEVTAPVFYDPKGERLGL
ncbi:sarcosine oxidase subunit alpha family protein [Leptospira interrogans]